MNRVSIILPPRAALIWIASATSDSLWSPVCRSTLFVTIAPRITPYGHSEWRRAMRASYGTAILHKRARPVPHHRRFYAILRRPNPRGCTILPLAQYQLGGR